MIKILKTFKQLHISQIIGGEIFKPQIIDFSSVFAKHEPMSKVLKVSNKDVSITLGTIINDETCNIYLATERTILSFEKYKRNLRWNFDYGFAPLYDLTLLTIYQK